MSVLYHVHGPTHSGKLQQTQAINAQNSTTQIVCNSILAGTISILMAAHGLTGPKAREYLEKMIRSRHAQSPMGYILDVSRLTSLMLFFTSGEDKFASKTDLVMEDEVSMPLVFLS